MLLGGSMAQADPAPATPASLLGITATEDISVSINYPIGNGNGLWVGASCPTDVSPFTPTEFTFVQFPVTGQLTGQNWKLKLDLRYIQPASPAVLSVHELPDNWTETNPPSGADCGAELTTLSLTGTEPPGYVTFSGGTLPAYVDQQINNDGFASLCVKVKECLTGGAGGFSRLFGFNDRENHFHTDNPPLSVELVSYTASGGNSRMVLEWTTASEVNTEGFNVYRSETEDGEYVKINQALIPAQGNPSTGASYSFVDTDVRPGRTYYYKLEDVDTSGNSTFHGPVWATVPGKGR